MKKDYNEEHELFVDSRYSISTNENKNDSVRVCGFKKDIKMLFEKSKF